ncbi:MAG: TetR/AcrR family transcriptional regulator [Treponema sp.]|jgi:AcrR family transcriptional regulator|nr:TetR/AcrR family transcriptional regulator [Treponema sp.]
MEKNENQHRKIRYSKMVLRDSLMELMKTKSILSISIKDICQLADVSRSTFYAHYKDQYDLLRQVEEETLDYFEDMLNKYRDIHSKKETTKMVEEMLTYIANNRNSIQVLLSENGDIGFQKKMFQHFTNHNQIKRYLSEKRQEDEARAFYSVFLVHGAIGLVQHWLKNDPSMPVPTLAKMLLKWTE